MCQGHPYVQGNTIKLWLSVASETGHPYIWEIIFQFIYPYKVRRVIPKYRENTLWMDSYVNVCRVIP